MEEDTLYNQGKPEMDEREAQRAREIVEDEELDIDEDSDADEVIDDELLEEITEE